MATHYKKCSQQTTLQSIEGQSELTPVPDSSTTSQPQKRSISDPFGPVPPFKKRQSDLNNHIVRTSEATKEELDEKVAEFVFGCNIPFGVVEHPLFKAMVSALRPGYTPPTRKSLGTKQLDSVHNKLQSRMKSMLKDKIVTMQQDGWSTQQNDPVIASSVVSSGKGYFVDAKDTGTTHKTAENLKDMVKESKSKAEGSYECKVRSFVTDNARNMVKLRHELEKEDDSLITYGCLSHVFNLLGQDLTPAPVMKHVIEINKYFRNHHMPSAWLKSQEGATRPILHNDTRWKGQLMCLDSYTKNRTYYIKFIQDYPGEVDQAIVKKIMDMNLFRQVSDLAAMLRPVAAALDKSQSDNTTIADAPELFFNLIAEPILQDNRDKIQKRFDFVIQPCHLAAYLFHPKYMGQQLSQTQVEQAKAWLISKSEDYLPAAIAFQAEAPPFPATFFTPAARIMNPVTWWKAVGAQCRDLPEGFTELIITLQSSVASSSSLERIFSTFGLVMTKLRNKLGLEKAQKLVFVYRMLRGPSELDY